MVLVLFTYASYATLMLYNTPDLSSTAWLDTGAFFVLARPFPFSPDARAGSSRLGGRD